ncbi:MAG: VOC family protein [Chloroflexales bacterium]|nr:VOC family protein [Chloroflexales bacterium]
MKASLDHIVIGAASLDQGVAYVKEHLGVAIPKGGEHAAMGTHNHLMQLGNNVFLEVLAVNPDAPALSRPRWYGFADPFVRRQLARRPQLLTWVVNTPDIAHTLAQSAFSFGEAMLMSRGDLHWYFGVPDDGRLLAGGILPYIIQWQTDTHPSGRLRDLGCTLKQLEIHHPQPDWLASILSAVGAAGCVALKPLEANATPFLAAHIETPIGLKTLSSHIDDTV